MYRVFVYGTLKRGFRWHDSFMTNCTFLRSTIIKGFKLHNYVNGSYPIMVQSDNPLDAVYGEVYSVPDEHTWWAILRLEQDYMPVEIEPYLWAFVAPEGTLLHRVAVNEPEVKKELGVYVYTG